MSTPNVCGFCRFAAGSRKFTWLNRLKNSEENVNLNFSVSWIFFMKLKSTFHDPRPRSVPPREVVSMLSWMGRKRAQTAAGLAKMLRPVPPVAGLALEPQPVVVVTLLRPAAVYPEPVRMASETSPKLV